MQAQNSMGASRFDDTYLFSFLGENGFPLNGDLPW